MTCGRRRFLVLGLVLAVAGCQAPRGRRIEGVTAGADVDAAVVDKSQRRLYLLADGHAVKSYRVAIGSNADGPKRREGDHRTPEGLYQLNPARPSYNGFNLFLPISYPNEADILAAARRGVSPDLLGGDIGLHGTGGGRTAVLHRVSDNWTDGCIAVSDPEIEEIARMIRRPIPIRIVP